MLHEAPGRRNLCWGSSRAPPQQPPRLEHGQRAVEPFGNGGEGAGLTQCGDGFELLVGGALAFGLEFKREAAAVVDRDHVRNAGLDAEALQDRRLDRLAIAAVGGMEGEHPGSAARAQVLKHCLLNRLLWTRALHDTSSGSCSRSAAPSGSQAEPSRLRISARRMTSAGTPY